MSRSVAGFKRKNLAQTVISVEVEEGYDTKKE